jgi:hypothetical protein
MPPTRRRPSSFKAGSCFGEVLRLLHLRRNTSATAAAAAAAVLLARAILVKQLSNTSTNYSRTPKVRFLVEFTQHSSFAFQIIHHLDASA